MLSYKCLFGTWLQAATRAASGFSSADSLRDLGLEFELVVSDYVEDDAILINGPPKIMLGSLNPDEHLIHVPLVAWSRAGNGAYGRRRSDRISCTSAARSHRIQALPPLSEKQLNVPKTEAEHVIQPHSVADNLDREAVAVVRVRWRFHPTSLAGSALLGQTQLTVTMPRSIYVLNTDPAPS